MLRLLVLALLLANAGYWAWTQGLLAAYGWAPATLSEPQRLAQQIRPEAMRLLDSSDAGLAEAPRSAAPAPTATECLQAGLFTDSQADALRPRLQSSLPAGSWALESSQAPERWIVYMGKYSSEESLAKKRSELRQLGLSVGPLINPALRPGLSLGHFSSRDDAESELTKVARRGVRTARVVLELPEVNGQMLRLPSVDAALKAQLEALKPQLADKTLQACR